jgi:Cu-Zn family superoxide dismutase
MPCDGQLTIEWFVKDVVLSQGRHSLLDADGAALVVHAGEDDYRTDPARSAWDRIACSILLH